MAYLKSTGLNTVHYPAGHVVQTTTQSRGNTETSGASDGSWSSTVIYHDIVPRYKNSDIRVQINTGVYVYNTASDAGVGMRISELISGGSTTYPTELSPSETHGSGNQGIFYINYSGSGITREGVFELCLNLLRPNVNTTTSTQYQLHYKGYSTNAVQVGGVYNGQWFITLQEIKR